MTRRDILKLPAAAAATAGGSAAKQPTYDFQPYAITITVRRGSPEHIAFEKIRKMAVVDERRKQEAFAASIFSEAFK